MINCRAHNCELFLVLALAVLVHPQFLVAKDRLTRLNGAVLSADVQEITEDGRVICSPDKITVDLQDLRSIHRTIPSSPINEDVTRVMLRGGGTLIANSVNIENGRVALTWFNSETKQLALKYVKAIQFPLAKNSGESALKTVDRDLREDNQKNDRVYARSEDKIIPVRCVIGTLDNKELTVQYQGETKRIARQRIAALSMAAMMDPPDRTGHCLLELTDGSTVWGDVQRLKNDKLALLVFPDVSLEIPWSNVRQLNVRSERLVYASDLEPVTVRQKALVTHPWPYQRDKNVMGRPLTLDGKEYDKGLGTHAMCSITYDVGDNYTTFAATIGIDDAAGDMGDCTFLVLGDNEQLFSQRVTAKDKPLEITIDVRGHRRITLQVDAGENLDIGDNANWCDARFLQ